MRSEERIEPFLKELGKLWAIRFPDLQFGQLMFNFLNWSNGKHGDPFFYEEEQFIARFKEFCTTGDK